MQNAECGTDGPSSALCILHSALCTPEPIPSATLKRKFARPSQAEARMWTGFKTFLIKDNVIGLAIAFIIGAAMVKLVTSVVDDVIMPVVNLATAATGGNWKDWYIPLTTAGADGPKMLVGNVIGAIINFLVIGFICWRIAKVFVKPKVVTP